MAGINPSILAVVAEKLDALEFNYAFVGGAIVGFLLDAPELSPVHPTDDLDIILEIVAARHYSDIEQKLRRTGFAHDTRPGASMCRWTLHELTVDIMPREGSFLGINTDWFNEALASATTKRIDGFKLKMISPVAFIATKLAAFSDRGKGDFFGSHDMEDLMTVIDGRDGIVDELAAAPKRLRDFIIFVASSIGSICGFPSGLSRLLTIRFCQSGTPPSPTAKAGAYRQADITDIVQDCWRWNFKGQEWGHCAWSSDGLGRTWKTELIGWIAKWCMALVVHLTTVQGYRIPAA